MIRGRGATPQTIDEVTIDNPNLFGRRKLKVRYRPLKDWTPDEICTATAVLVCYFAELGGFQTIDDAAMRSVITRIRAGVTEEQCRWAILAKVASLGETHAERIGKRTFVASPERFFTSAQIETWLDKSPEMRAAIDAANRAESVRRAADPAVQAKTRQQHAAAAAATDSYAEQRRKAAEREREIKARWRQREGGAP